MAGLVGDDPEGSGLGAGAEQGALRPGEGFNTGDVVDVDVEHRADGGDGLLVEIDAYGRQGARGQPVAVGEAAEEDFGLPGAEACVRQAGEEPSIVVETRDAPLGERSGVKNLQADWHVLEVFRALLGGDDDHLAHRRLVLSLLGVGYAD